MGEEPANSSPTHISWGGSHLKRKPTKRNTSHAQAHILHLDTNPRIHTHTPAQTLTSFGNPHPFVSSQEVMRYLSAFAEEHALLQHVRCGVEVVGVAPLTAAGADGSKQAQQQAQQQQQQQGGEEQGARWCRWEVQTRRVGGSDGGSGASSGRGDLNQDHSVESVEYDAIVVCNGHYSEPRVPILRGQDVFPGLQMHRWVHGEILHASLTHACSHRTTPNLNQNQTAHGGCTVAQHTKALSLGMACGSPRLDCPCPAKLQSQLPPT